MTNIYRNNLNLLENINPKLKEKVLNITYTDKIKYIKNPFPNIYLNGKNLHSKKNPNAEAKNLISNINLKKINETIFLFLGMGLGYHIKMFIDNYGEFIQGSQIIIIEKKPEIFDQLLRHSNISFLKNTKIFVDEKLSTIENYFNSIDPMLFGGYKIIKLKGALAENPQYYLLVEKVFKKVLSSKLSDILTRFSFETLWIRNIIENIPNLRFSSPINSLKGIGTNYTSLITGAGPSLLSQLKTIKALSKKIFIIAVDTALPSLLKFNIKPDIVVTLDGQFQSLYDFTYLFTNNNKISQRPILVYDLLAYPKIVKNYKNNSYFTSSLNIQNDNKNHNIFVDNPFIQYIKQSIIPFDGLPCGGSVLTTAIELALYMNFKNIILIGADLSYTKFKTHVNSSPLYNNFLYSGNRLSPIVTKNIYSILNRKIFNAPGIKSKFVFTDYTLMSYKIWIENRYKHKNRIINSTEDGINISNLRHIPLDSFSKKINKLAKLNISKKIELSNKDILKNFLCELNKNINNLIYLIENQEFTYDKLWQIFPYFYNIIIESKKVLNDEKKIERYFYNFAKYIKRIINKSLHQLSMY